MSAMNDARVLRGRYAARLRLGAACAEARAEALLADAREARALADALEGDEPPALAEITKRATALFRGQEI